VKCACAERREKPWGPPASPKCAICCARSRGPTIPAVDRLLTRRAVPGTVGRQARTHAGPVGRYAPILDSLRNARASPVDADGREPHRGRRSPPLPARWGRTPLAEAARSQTPPFRAPVFNLTGKRLLQQPILGLRPLAWPERPCRARGQAPQPRPVNLGARSCNPAGAAIVNLAVEGLLCSLTVAESGPGR